jgi:hypothetical protein
MAYERREIAYCWGDRRELPRILDDTFDIIDISRSNATAHASM